MSTSSHQTVPVSVSRTGKYGSGPTPNSTKVNREINRFGLHDLAGELYREGPDPVTIQILEEAHFLPRNVPVLSDSGGFDLKPQPSQPPPYASTSSKSDIDESGRTIGLGSLRFSPLKLHRIYGRPGNLPVLNLTGLKTSHIVYAASNVVVYFDYYSNTQSILQGHQHKISCLATDTNSTYLATGEMAKEPMLIVWNLKTGFPIKRFSNATVDSLVGIRAIGFVGGGTNCLGMINETSELQMTLGDEENYKKVKKQSVSIWYFGEQAQRAHHHTDVHAEAKVDLPEEVRRQSMIDFSPDFHHQFVTTGDYQVVFYTWIRSEKKIIFHVPSGHMKFMKRLKRFTATIWVMDSVLTASASGYIVEWKPQGPLGLEPSPNPHLNIKEFRRFIKIDEQVGLTALVAYKEFIVVGDEEGGVRFLDHKFRLLRWTRTGFKRIIRSIAFNFVDTQPQWKNELRASYSRAYYDHNTFHRRENSTVYDYTFGGGKYHVPSQTTIERNPLHGDEECLDLVVGYDDGSVAYFHLAEEKVDTILSETLGPDPIVALDASPTTKHIAISTQSGAIHLIDYESNEVIHSQKIFKKEVEVTYLKFHTSGSFLVIGSSNGTLYFRRAFTLGLMDNPLHLGKEHIKKIIFSSCGLFMGLFATDRTVSLCNYNPGRRSWGIRGKHRSHYRPIVDIIFFMDKTVGHQRFFSLGQDRRLIEYDILESIATKGLKILTTTALEQTHIPTSMVFDAPFPNHGPILHYATTNNKIRLFDQDELKIRKTCQGPQYGAPLNQMVAISPDSDKGRTKNFILITLGNKIGLIKTPVDGNPFKYMAVLGHPTEIQNIGVGSKGNEIFTRADSDKCIFMWIPDLLVLDNCTMAGGMGVIPFKHYLDAGLPSNLSVVNDIQNIFYHQMMKRATNQHELIKMKLTLPLADIPTVMRTCGYFPSELEIDMLLEEVNFILGVKYGSKQAEIGFEDFLILFANHKDTGIHDDEVLQAFQILGDENEFNELCISRENFIAFITTQGESLKEIDLPHFLPNFYRPVLRKTEANEIKKPWYLKSASFMSTSSIGSLFQRSRSQASSISVYGEGSISRDSRDSIFHLDLSRSSTLSKDSKSSSSYEKPSKVLSIARESAISQDFDVWSSDKKEMIEDISANFFINHLLPHEVNAALEFELTALADEIADLDRIFEANPVKKPFDEIVQRWKGRDEWRYFKEVFEKLKHDNVPMDERMDVAIEMDRCFRRGHGSDLEQGDSGLEYEGEDENLVTLSLPATKGSHKHEIIEEEDAELDDQIDQTENHNAVNVHNRVNPFEVTYSKGQQDEDVGSVKEFVAVNSNEGTRIQPDTASIGGSISSRDVVMSSSDEEEMEVDSLDESDITEGNPLSRPFTGISEKI